MRQASYVIAVFGAAGELGRMVSEVLRARGFPVREWRLYDSWDRLGDVPESDLAEPLSGPDRIDLNGADLVFMCAAEELCVEWAPRAVEAGAAVIDLTGAFADRLDVPVVVPEVNPEAVGDGVEYGIVASPLPGAIALSVVLRPLDEAARLKRVVTSCYEPVSSAGRDGIEELAEQTRSLLSGRPVETSVFSQRIAFNLIPQVGEFLDGGGTRGEWQIESQVRRLLDLPELPITVTAVRVPTFFGQGYTVNVEMERPIDATAARAVLQEAPGVMVSDDGSAPTFPTLIDLPDTDATHVGRVRDDATVSSGLNLWAAIDGLRKGGAVNAVQLAEIIVRDYR